MNTLHVKKGDTAVVLSGKEKGKSGKIISVRIGHQDYSGTSRTGG